MRPRNKTGRTDWRDKPFAVIAPAGSAVRLAAVNRAASLAGLLPGQSLTDARALEPELRAVPADPRADALCLGTLARWAVRYTPWAAVSGLEAGGAARSMARYRWLCSFFLPVCPGRPGTIDGELCLLIDLVGGLHELGYSARAGLADTPGAAWAVARYVAARGGARQVIVPSGGQARVLGPLPVAGLRLDDPTRETKPGSVGGAPDR